MEEVCDQRRAELIVALVLFRGWDRKSDSRPVRRVRSLGAEADTVRNGYSANVLEKDCYPFY